MALLSVSELSKRFSGLQALSDVGFEIERGQIVGIIGPNGAGKTTLVNLITGAASASGGAMSFEGRDILGLPTHEIARLGIRRTFQQIRIFEDLSVLENVLVGMDFQLRSGYGATILGLRRVAGEEERAKSVAMGLLRRMRGGLQDMAHRKARELSYADKRRLEIARALAGEPKLLLLDEPACGMAPQEMRDLTEDLRQLNVNGTAVLLIEHKMSLIEGLTERVIVLDQGKKIAEGPFETVRRNPTVIEAYLGRGYAHAGTQAG